METAPQFIKNEQGKNILAIISIEKYNDLKYENANLREENIPDWHKEILDNDIKALEQDLKNQSLDEESWESIRKEIKAKYRY